MPLLVRVVAVGAGGLGRDGGIVITDRMDTLNLDSGFSSKQPRSLHRRYTTAFIGDVPLSFLT
jgi:hypothetical protein